MAGRHAATERRDETLRLEYAALGMTPPQPAREHVSLAQRLASRDSYDEDRAVEDSRGIEAL